MQPKRHMSFYQPIPASLAFRQLRKASNFGQTVGTIERHSLVWLIIAFQDLMKSCTARLGNVQKNDSVLAGIHMLVLAR